MVFGMLKVCGEYSMRKKILYVVFFMAFMNIIFSSAYSITLPNATSYYEWDSGRYLSSSAYVYSSSAVKLANGDYLLVASGYQGSNSNSKWLWVGVCDDITNTSTCKEVYFYQSCCVYSWRDSGYFVIVDETNTTYLTYDRVRVYIVENYGNGRLWWFYNTGANYTSWSSGSWYPTNPYVSSIAMNHLYLSRGKISIRHGKLTSCSTYYGPLIFFWDDYGNRIYYIKANCNDPSVLGYTDYVSSYADSQSDFAHWGNAIHISPSTQYDWLFIGGGYTDCDSDGTYDDRTPYIYRQYSNNYESAVFPISDSCLLNFGSDNNHRTYMDAFYDGNGNIQTLVALANGDGTNDADNNKEIWVAVYRKPWGSITSSSSYTRYKIDESKSWQNLGPPHFMDEKHFFFRAYDGTKWYIFSCGINDDDKKISCSYVDTGTYGDDFLSDFNHYTYYENGNWNIIYGYAWWDGSNGHLKWKFRKYIYDTKILIKDEISGSASPGKIEIFGNNYFSINTPITAYLSKNSFSQDSIVKVYNDYISRFYFYKNPLNAYLLNVSETPAVQVVFQIQPATSDVIFRIKKITNDGLITIHEQKPDATGKVTTYLAQNNVYYIYIEDSQGERVIGNYIASYATTETIYLLGSSSDSGTSISLSVSKDDSINNVKIKTEYNVTQGYIRVTYDDTTNSTQYVELHIYNETNDEVFFANSSQQSVVFNFVNATINSTYYIKLYAKRNTTDVVFSDYIRFYESEGINIPIKKEVLNIMVLLFIVAIALLTPQAYRKQGIMLMTAIIVLFNVFGWLSLSYYVISLIVFIALLVVLVG